MQFLFSSVSMWHLRLLSIAIVVLALVWIAIAWMFASDRIWVVPGVFLLITGLIKIIGIQVWDKLGSTESSDSR